MYGRERRGEESVRRREKREEHAAQSQFAVVFAFRIHLYAILATALTRSPPPYHTHTHSRLACESVCGFMKNYNSQHQAYRAINSTERIPTRTCVWLTRSFTLSLFACVCVCVWQVNFDTGCVWDNSLLIIFFELQFFLAALPPCRR